MQFYRLYNTEIYSDIELLNKTVSCSKNPDYEIQEVSKSPIDLNHTIYHRIYHLKKRLVSFSKNKNVFGIRFHNYADFIINNDSGKILYYKRKNTTLSTLRHLINDQVIPLALSLLNKTLFHASSVIIDNQSVSFHAPSGFGKSTLAAYFSDKGHIVLSDDTVLFDYQNNSVYSYLSYQALKLWPDTMENIFSEIPNRSEVSQFNHKMLIEIKNTNNPVKNNRYLHKAVYFISESENVSIEKVSKTYAFSKLIQNILRLDLKNKEMNKVQFEFINNLLESLDCYHLGYPKNYESLQDVYNLVKNN